MFSRERPGFDAVVGNPPWNEIKVERFFFYIPYRPGLGGLPSRERERAVAELIEERPELARSFEMEKTRAHTQRGALRSDEYEPTPGDPDLYKFFCQRYRALLRMGGYLGVVLPRSAFNTEGSEGFRCWLHQRTTVRRVDFLLNRRRWMFDTHPQYSVALLAAQKSRPRAEHHVEVAGVADSLAAWRVQTQNAGIPFAESALGPARVIPLLRSQTESDVLAKVRRGSPFPLGPGGRWKCFAVAELHETKDKKFWQAGAGTHYVWKGESFDHYDPHGAEQRRCSVDAALLQKVSKPRPGSGQLLRSLPLVRRREAVRRELTRGRVAFRGVTNRTNTRTVLACLIPSNVFLANSAPYLTFVDGDERTQAAAVGILNSLPFDWQGRRYVELNLNFFILESLVVPDLRERDFNAIAHTAARLSAVDDRFRDFAAATGVPCGPLPDAERERLRIEIDARVARAWDLDSDDLAVMLDDFTTRAVPVAYRTALHRRLGELLEEPG